MSPLLIPILALLIPIVAILAGTYAKIAATKAESAKDLSRATGGLEDALDEARADRERLRRRVEALEAIVTSDGFDLEREARRAGLTSSSRDGVADPAGRIDPGLLDVEPLRSSADASRQRGREAG